MIRTHWKHKVKKYTFTVREWRCCEHIWQLLLSKNYPERFNWNPVCPDCSRTYLMGRPFIN